MAVRGFFFDFSFKRFLKISRKNYTTYGGSETGFRQLSRWAFWWYEAKKKTGTGIFLPGPILVNIIFENVPDVKMGKTQRI